MAVARRGRLWTLLMRQYWCLQEKRYLPLPSGLAVTYLDRVTLDMGWFLDSVFLRAGVSLRLGVKLLSAFLFALKLYSATFLRCEHRCSELVTGWEWRTFRSYCSPATLTWSSLEGVLSLALSASQLMKNPKLQKVRKDFTTFKLSIPYHH